MSDALIQHIFDIERAAAASNKQEFLRLLSVLVDGVISNDDGFAEWVVTPVNFEKLKALASEHFSVPAKAMQLKARVPNRNKRAVFFLKAIINGVTRSV